MIPTSMMRMTLPGEAALNLHHTRAIISVPPVLPPREMERPIPKPAIIPPRKVHMSFPLEIANSCMKSTGMILGITLSIIDVITMAYIVFPPNPVPNIFVPMMRRSTLSTK